MSNVTLPPPREPAIDPRTNTFSRNWILYFQQMFQRVGGYDAQTLTAISALITQALASIADNKVELAFADNQKPQQKDDIEITFATVPASITDTQEEQTCDAQIAELRKEIAALRNEIAMQPDQTASIGEIRKRLKDIATPDITGSRGANDALASLLTALVGYGLITDSTT